MVKILREVYISCGKGFWESGLVFVLRFVYFKGSKGINRLGFVCCFLLCGFIFCVFLRVFFIVLTEKSKLCLYIICYREDRNVFFGILREVKELWLVVFEELLFLRNYNNVSYNTFFFGEGFDC